MTENDFAQRCSHCGETIHADELHEAGSGVHKKCVRANRLDDPHDITQTIRAFVLPGPPGKRFIEVDVPLDSKAIGVFWSTKHVWFCLYALVRKSETRTERIRVYCGTNDTDCEVRSMRFLNATEIKDNIAFWFTDAPSHRSLGKQ